MFFFIVLTRIFFLLHSKIFDKSGELNLFTHHTLSYIVLHNLEHCTIFSLFTIQFSFLFYDWLYFFGSLHLIIMIKKKQQRKKSRKSLDKCIQYIYDFFSFCLYHYILVSLFARKYSSLELNVWHIQLLFFNWIGFGSNLGGNNDGDAVSNRFFHHIVICKYHKYIFEFKKIIWVLKKPKTADLNLKKFFFRSVCIWGRWLV